MVRGLALAAVAVAAGLAYWRLAPRPKPQSQPAAVARTATVRTGTLERTIRVSGTTAAARHVSVLAPPMPGSRSRIGGEGGRGGSHEFQLTLQKLAPPGSRVRKGDVVAEFDPQYMLLRLDDYRASLVQDGMNLERLKALLDLRRKAYEQRVRVARGRMDKARLDLRTAPVRSAIHTERLKLNLEEAQAQHRELERNMLYVDISESSAIRRSEMELRISDLELKRAEANLNRMVVRAPIDGIVVVRPIQRGGEQGEIQAGDQLHSGHVFMQIMDPRSMIVEANANQVEAEQLQIGLRAHVRLDTYADLELPARLVSIGAFAVTGGSRRGFITQIPIRLGLEKMDPRVLPNFSASADLIVQSEKDAAIVPREAVFAGGPGGQPLAFVQGPAGWERRELVLGTSNNVEVAVRAGLRPGEVVALERPAGQ